MTGAPIISKAIGRPEFLVCPKDGSKWSKDLAQKRVGGELYYGEPPSRPRCGTVLESEKPSRQSGAQCAYQLRGLRLPWFPN